MNETLVNKEQMLASLYSDKKPKPNTVEEVALRVAGVFESIATKGAPAYAEVCFAGKAEIQSLNLPRERGEDRLRILESSRVSFAERLTADVFAETQLFFGDYNIDYPSTDFDKAVSGLEAVLEEHGQPALDSIEGVTRLMHKVFLHLKDFNTKSFIEPRPYIAGLFAALENLPLAELASTPNKSSKSFYDRTVRDKISKLVTFGRISNTPVMLSLLQELPSLAEKANAGPDGLANYKAVLGNILDYLGSCYLETGKVPELSVVRANLEKFGSDSSSEPPQAYQAPNITINDVLTAALTQPSRNGNRNGSSSLHYKIEALDAIAGFKVVGFDISGHRTSKRLRKQDEATSKRLNVYFRTPIMDLRVSLSFDGLKVEQDDVEGLQELGKQCLSRLDRSDNFYLSTSLAIDKFLYFRS